MSLKKRLRQKRIEQLNQVQVATPCPARWEEMIGDEKVRFCEGCQLPVYNLSAMDVEEAAERIAQDDGRLCVRFYRRPDGTILTRDCPVGIQKAHERRRAFINRMAAGLGITVAGVVLMPAQGAVDRPAARRAALISAAKSGDMERMRAMVDAGVSPNATHGHGMTPLMYAARNGQLDSVRLLLSRGADLSMKDAEGNTALKLARQDKHPQIVAALVEAGARE